MDAKKQRGLQWAALLVLVIAAGYAGLKFGGALRARNAPEIVEAPDFPWKPGDPFPDVRLADSLGAESGSAELVKGRGGAVVLFLDPNCEGCSEMAARWERGVSEGIIESDRVFGVTSASAAVNSQYRSSHALTFPLYEDTENAFLQRYGVVTYPMEVVVGASGTIQSLSTDSKTPIDGASLRALIEQ